MNETAKVKVLLVGDSPKVLSACRRRLETNGCHCEFAECEREVWNVLEQRQFDIVLSVHRGRSARTESLGALLSGSRTTLFYALPVENGCWWVPILKVGEECFGAPALRPAEFGNALDEAVQQVRAGLPSPALTRTALPVLPAPRRHDREPAHAPNAEALQPVCIGPLPGHAKVGEHARPPGDREGPTRSQIYRRVERSAARS